MWSKWIQSYRDLPVLMNQWNSVVRWELRTKLFLRTLEFYWQEGHTAHATREEALEETRQMLDVYTDFAVNEAAIPVIPGAKSDAEKFAGADTTYSLEAMMGDCKALQFCTSHFLGQNFAQAFEVKYLDQNGQLQHCWTTSWGLSTRVIGGIIMVHGDDQGLVLPPRLAPTQVVIVPIFKTDEEKSSVRKAARELKEQLIKANLRVTLDEREGFSPGWKFNDWEMRGVPVRVELGPKDVAKQAAILARRDKPGKEAKVSAPLADLAGTIEKLLFDIQQSLFDKALAFRRAHTQETKNYDELKKAVETGFVFAFWCGDSQCEEKIKEETRATMRCIPLDQAAVMGQAGALGPGTCVYCGKLAKERAIFARAY
jgi:prolyl-tRNA synthetase